jgi:hypothetical protein
LKSKQFSLFDEPDNPPEDFFESVHEVFEYAGRALGKPVVNPPVDEVESPALVAARERRLEKAAALGLVAQWGDYRKAKGHISMHDPGSREWHDVPCRDAPGGAQREARKRSELYRSTGDSRAFDFTAAEMEAIWEEENPPLEEEGIVEEYPPED